MAHSHHTDDLPASPAASATSGRGRGSEFLSVPTEAASSNTRPAVGRIHHRDGRLRSAGDGHLVNPAPLPSLDELAGDPDRAAALPPESAVALLASCTVAQSALIGRLLSLPATAHPAPDDLPEDRLLDVHEAAERLGTSTDYLYRHSSKLPFTIRIGSRLRFSARGIERFIRTRQGR